MAASLSLGRCGRHTPSKIAALPSPPAVPIERRPRVFLPYVPNRVKILFPLVGS
jgi:hypothetical protein